MPDSIYLEVIEGSHAQSYNLILRIPSGKRDTVRLTYTLDLHIIPVGPYLIVHQPMQLELDHRALCETFLKEARKVGAKVTRQQEDEIVTELQKFLPRYYTLGEAGRIMP